MRRGRGRAPLFRTRSRQQAGAIAVPRRGAPRRSSPARPGWPSPQESATTTTWLLAMLVCCHGTKAERRPQALATGIKPGGPTREAARKVHSRWLSPGLGAQPVKITVLTHLEKENGSSRDVVVDQVADGLREAGHSVSILAVHRDVNKLLRGVARQKPGLIFNLMEMFGDN